MNQAKISTSLMPDNLPMPHAWQFANDISMKNSVRNEIYPGFDFGNPVGHVINFVAINDAYYSAAAFHGKVGTSNRKW